MARLQFGPQAGLLQIVVAVGTIACGGLAIPHVLKQSGRAMRAMRAGLPAMTRIVVAAGTIAFGGLEKPQVLKQSTPALR